MRIRHKPWARPEIAASAFCVDDPRALRGRWRGAYPEPEHPLHVELGCGKGGFITAAAARYPDINFLAFDIKSEMLGVAKRKAEAAFGENPQNLRLAICNIEHIAEVLSPEDAPDRIYINFCNPWSHNKHKKRRLTHPRQLVQYQTFLRGELFFKTDDAELFEESLSYFSYCGWETADVTRDLHADEPEWNIRTEHEEMFLSEGKKICFLRAAPPKEAFGKPVQTLAKEALRHAEGMAQEGP